MQTPRPKVTFGSAQISKRVEACENVARAYGWDETKIAAFAKEARNAFAYEEAMAVIHRDFDVIS